MSRECPEGKLRSADIIGTKQTPSCDLTFLRAPVLLFRDIKSVPLIMS